MEKLIEAKFTKCKERCRNYRNPGRDRILHPVFGVLGFLFIIFTPLFLTKGMLNPENSGAEKITWAFVVLFTGCCGIAMARSFFANNIIGKSLFIFRDDRGILHCHEDSKLSPNPPYYEVGGPVLYIRQGGWFRKVYILHTPSIGHWKLANWDCESFTLSAFNGTQRITANDPEYILDILQRFSGLSDLIVKFDSTKANNQHLISNIESIIDGIKKSKDRSKSKHAQEIREKLENALKTLPSN
ncbi:MAG: hypothetical protein PHD51_00300 [Patescibacteria group bacterium]|nr:hypothetical protein [Patescibacteria group bacterium]MDD5490690.1 hypothetical protein [Patescibacteria group bacterium]